MKKEHQKALGQFLGRVVVLAYSSAAISYAFKVDYLRVLAGAFGLVTLYILAAGSVRELDVRKSD